MYVYLQQGVAKCLQDGRMYAVIVYTVWDNMTLTFHSVSFCFYARVEPSYGSFVSSVSSFYRTKIIFGRTDEKTVASKLNDWSRYDTIKCNLKGLHWGRFVVLTVLTNDRDEQQLQETTHSPFRSNWPQGTNYFPPVTGGRSKN